MKNVLLLLTFLGIFVSCGAPEGKTKAKFNLGFAVGPFSSGGLMVFGKKEDTPGVYFSKRILSSTDTVELLNGTWSFKTVAWDGLNFMEGNVKCSGAEYINLSGSDTDVVLNFTKKECQDGDVFGAPVSQGQVGQFNPLTLVTCNNDKAILENESEEIDSNCVRGATKSFEIVIPEFDDQGNFSIATGLRSACQDYSNTSLREENTNLRIPMFNDKDAPLTFVVFSYPELGCSGAPEVIDARQEIGFRLNVDFYQNKSMVTIKSNYCQGNNLTNIVTSNSFQFRANTYHMICTPNQFDQAFGSNPTNKYVLGANLDFTGADFSNGYTIGAGGELYGNGKTLSNIVHNFSGTPSSRGGIFQSINGNISNLRVNNLVVDVDYNNVDSSGLGAVFGSRGANTSIHLENIELSNVHLDIENSGSTVNVERIGLLGGTFETTAEVKNIKVFNSSITFDGNAGNEIREAGALFGRFGGNLRGVEVGNFNFYSETGNNLDAIKSIGGVVGRTTQGNYRDIDVYGLNMTLDRKVEAAGGAFGHLAEATDFTSISTQGVINLTENTLTHPDIGGVAGNVTNGSPFNAELINSKVDINARSGAGGAGPVGGIFGKGSATPTNLRMARYEGNIHGKTTCGGIIGSNISGGQIDYSSSFGSVNCAGGAVGGIVGDAYGSTVAHVYSAMNVINNATVGGGGLVGNTTGNLDESYFDGSLNGTNPMAGTKDGLLVGNCASCNVTNSYTYVGDSGETALGTAGTATTADCALLDNSGSNQCTGYANLSLLNSWASSNLTNINWEIADDGKYRQFSDKFFHRYNSSIGAKSKPFGIGSIEDWEIFGKLQLIEPSFKLKGASYILLADLDFDNNQSLFTPWKEFGGHFMGNDYTIRNVTFSETGTESLGLFRKLIPGAMIDHETPSGFKKLYLKNFNITQNGAFSAGALAGEANFGSTGFVGIYGVEVWNSSIRSTMSTGGLVGRLQSTGTDNFEVEDIRIRSTEVIGASSTGTGGIVGNISMTTATKKTIFNTLIDGSSEVKQSATQSYIGGIIGTASNINGAALISYAKIDADNYGGGIIGSLTNSNVQYLLADNNISACGGANCGGLAGNSAATTTISHSQNHVYFGGSPATIVGTQAGTTITNVISEDGNSYDSASAAKTTSLTCFSDPTAFCEPFSLAAEHFIWEENSYPKLRWIEHILKAHP